MFKISIPKPCHEDWSKMTPNQQGRHCTACAKTVVDFTRMADHEVQHFFINRKPEEATCGRFTGAQLGRITITLPHNVFELNMAGWKKFLAACLLAFSTMLFSCDTTVSKVDNKMQPIVNASVSKKDSIPASGGYVGGLFTKWESDVTIEPGCAATTGVSVYYDSSFNKSQLPAADTTQAANNSTDFMRDTLLFSAPTSQQKTDSALIKPPAQDATDCNDQNFINL